MIEFTVKTPMSKVLPVTTAPSSIFHQKCEKVTEVTSEIQQNLYDILETAKKNNAIGLAGPHVGINLQLVVLNVNQPIFMVNPEIVWQSNARIISEESSVSFPGRYVNVERHTAVIVKFIDETGNQQNRKFKDLEAICAQHEIDQMNGITILDRAIIEDSNVYRPKVLPLVTEPDPRLHTPSQTVDVSEINDEMKNFIQDMLATMYENEGIGLAAVQVGVHKRIVVIDIDSYHTEEQVHGGQPILMINPTIIDRSEEQITFKEGCLSLPTITSDVVRDERVTVEYLDINRVKQALLCDGLLSVCVQHEIDHTNGVVFIERISRLKREFFMKKLHKIKQNA